MKWTTSSLESCKCLACLITAEKNGSVRDVDLMSAGNRFSQKIVSGMKPPYRLIANSLQTQNLTSYIGHLVTVSNFFFFLIPLDLLNYFETNEF